MGNETVSIMETESIKSENSSRSRRSRSHRDRNNFRQHSHRSTRSSKSRKNEDMAPFQTAVTLTPDNRDGQEIIEVQILPQDDNWGENTTAITGNTSEQSQSTEDVSNWPGEPDTGIGFMCQRYVACAYLNSAGAARILGIFPMPGISHNILSSKLMKGLIAAGHDVTMISAYPLKDVPKNGKYTDIVLEELSAQFQNMVTVNNLFQMNDDNMVAMMQKMTNMFLGYSNQTLHDPKVRQLLETHQKFDAVILEQFSNDALKVFPHLFNCPLIILSSMGPNAWVNPLVGNPQPVSYAAHLLAGDFSNDLSLFNRGKNLLFYLLEYFLREFYILPKHDDVMHQAFPNAPPLHELFTNVSLVLLNSHSSLYPAMPIVPNMVEVGGYFIDPPQKLPKDLQDFLDGAKDGAIYFSMGSNLKSKDMPPERRKIFLNVLGRLKQKVLWKFEEDLPGRPANVMIRKWLPQQDILAHPNIKLFITHGGLLSTTETIYHGVPVLAIPVFGDQSANADRAVSYGYGLKIEYSSPDFTEEHFSKVLNELLHNPQYRENAQRRSKIYHDRPMGPMETAVYWVEYVIRYKGAPHLRVAGVRLPWYKYYMVDVLGVILLAILSVIITLKIVLRKLFCSRKVTKEKTN